MPVAIVASSSKKRTISMVGSTCLFFILFSFHPEQQSNECLSYHRVYMTFLLIFSFLVSLANKKRNFLQFVFIFCLSTDKSVDV